MDQREVLRLDAVVRDLEDKRVVDLEEWLEPRELLVERNSSFGTDDPNGALRYPGECFGK